MVASIDLQVLLRLPMRGHVSCATCVSRTDVSIRLVLQIWWIFCLLIIAEGAELIQTLYHLLCADRLECMEACNAVDECMAFNGFSRGLLTCSTRFMITTTTMWHTAPACSCELMTPASFSA